VLHKFEENGNIKYFQSGFLSKRKESWTIGGIDSVERRGDRSFTMFKTYDFGTIKTCEKLPEVFTTCSIHFDGYHYFLMTPFEKPVTSTFGKKPYISGDPGVRCFNTFYDPSEEMCVEVGTGAADKMYQLLLQLDKMISKRSNANAKSKKILSKKIKELKRKISNKQSDLHWKTAKWLCNDYKQIVLPHFESKNMSSVPNRNIRTKTVRQMSVLAHAKFLQRLKTKAEETRTELVIVDEKYTTMTCGRCCERNPDVGNQRDWRCPKCKWHHHRDFNAARNILLKLILQDTA
jgi:putative transposase